VPEHCVTSVVELRRLITALRADARGGAVDPFLEELQTAVADSATVSVAGTGTVQSLSSPAGRQETTK
jgi:hypothetical protein